MNHVTPPGLQKHDNLNLKGFHPFGVVKKRLKGENLCPFGVVRKRLRREMLFPMG